MLFERKKKILKMKKKRLKIIKIYKKYLESHKYKTHQNIKNNKFIEQLLNSIGEFFNKDHNIQIIFKHLNRQKLYEHKDVVSIRNKFIHFRKFKNADFFKEGVNLLFTAINQKGSAQMIANFISYKIKRIKRQKYFISFLKKIITTFIKNKYSKVYGIKIKITGRVNGAPRSKKNTLLIKKMPLQSINSKIEQSQTTAYTKNGTFGIKVWVYDKKIKNNMFLQPKKIKYKKVKKGVIKKMDFKANKLKLGEIGLKAYESGIITAKQLEAARQAISRKTSRVGKLYIKVFPDLPITRKPSDSRMGKGKGATSHWGTKVKCGTVIFELLGVKKSTAIEAFKTGGAKLPIKTKIFK